MDREAQGRRRIRREGEEEGREKAQVRAQGHRGGADRVKQSRVTGWESRPETLQRETPR